MGGRLQMAPCSVDLERGVAKVVAGLSVEPRPCRLRPGQAPTQSGRSRSGYVFVAWASSGESVFISGGERFEPRTLVE